MSWSVSLSRTNTTQSSLLYLVCPFVLSQQCGGIILKSIAIKPPCVVVAECEGIRKIVFDWNVSSAVAVGDGFICLTQTQCALFYYYLFFSPPWKFNLPHSQSVGRSVAYAYLYHLISNCPPIPLSNMNIDSLAPVLLSATKQGD